MGKQKAPRALPENAAQAIGRRLRVSPYKLNLVAEMIRGKKADRALAELAFSRKRIARDVRKILQSAIANAENNHGLDVDKLFVSQAFVGKSMVIKRFQPKSKGRAGRILKPFAHITVVVEAREPPAPAVKTEPGKAGPGKTGPGAEAQPEAA
jgi:large subunit ribosomal protein L22